MFSLKRRESEASQVVLLCCLALYIVSQVFNHVHVDLFYTCVLLCALFCQKMRQHDKKGEEK